MGRGEYIEVKDESQLGEVGKQLMEYYIRTIIEARLPEIRKMAVSENPHVDSDYIVTLINQEIEKHVPEITEKFNQMAMFLLEFVVRGQFNTLRDFESKFEDLVERTLLRHYDYSRYLASFRQKISEILDQASVNPSDIDKPIGNA